MQKNGTIICNCCGNELPRLGGCYEDHLQIRKVWGYLSAQDGVSEEMDICAACLSRWEQTFALAPEYRDVTELL